MKFINFKISREHAFPLDNIAHVRSRKIFTILVQTFKIPDFVWFQSPGNQFLFSEPVRPLKYVQISLIVDIISNILFFYCRKSN